MLDFSVDLNKYNLNEYSKLKFNIDLDETVKDKVKVTPPTQPEKVILSKDDIQYNMHIIQHNKVFGSYRKRPTNKSEMFGPIDNTFRIINMMETTTNETDEIEDASDKRKAITGMAAKSYPINLLRQIIKFLNITEQQIQKYLGHNTLVDIAKLKAEQLVKIIENHMKTHDLILK